MPKESKQKELETQLDNSKEEGEPEETPEEGFVEIEGKEGKFKEDPDNLGEALLDDNDEPIPFEEEKGEGFVEIDGKKFKEDPQSPGEALLDEHEEPIPFEEEGKEEFKMPDKFKGKSVEEIAKSYGELEKMIEKKAEEKALEIVKKKKEKGEKELEEESEPEPVEVPMVDGKPDFPKMTPGQFAGWMIQEIDKRAEVKARKIYEEGSRVKESVQSEIREAQKGHPLLKTSEDYRELVLAIIGSAASKDKTVSLEDACKKVDTLIGKKEGPVVDEEKEKLKKAKAIIEKRPGAPAAGGPKTDEERIKEGMLSPGQGPGELGGL